MYVFIYISPKIKEEQWDIKLAQEQPNRKFSEDNDFGYAQHYKETKHHFDFANAKVLQLQLEPHYQRRKQIEGIYIKMNKELTCNLKSGTEVDPNWLPLLTTRKKFKIPSWEVRGVRKNHSTPDSTKISTFGIFQRICNCTCTHIRSWNWLLPVLYLS